MNLNPKRLKTACYVSATSMSVITNISPLLFLTFRELYDISYTLLGLLVLINFVTQLIIDLVFSFFSHRFNIPMTVRITPIVTVLGFAVFAIMPVVMPENAYLWLVVGTVLFSVSGGLGEVLLSPTIAALPSDNPERDMSKLHSIYAWGVVCMVIISTAFLSLTEAKIWYILPLGFSLIPLTATFLFAGATFPEMKTPERASGALKMLKDKRLLLFLFVMLLGGAAECTMAQWCSGYAEGALGLPKALGDIFGVALFAVMLGLGRSLYAKFGKRIYPVLIFGSIGAVVCYLVAAISPYAAVGLVACALTGFFTSMLWPGNLIASSDGLKGGGVFLFAIMAAAGDLGASLGPQLVGIITDAAIVTPSLIDLSATLGIAAEQLGMKLGMLIAALFPLISIPIYLILAKKKEQK